MSNQTQTMIYDQGNAGIARIRPNLFSADRTAAWPPCRAGNKYDPRAPLRGPSASSDVSRFVGEQAIQIHGGFGMSEELIIGHLFRRLILNASLLADSDWHRQRLREAQ